MPGEGATPALRSFLPGEMAVDGGPPRRTVRDWVTDVLVFAGAVLLGLVAYGLAQQYDRPPLWVAALDLPLGVLACLSLWWRRRCPLVVALLAVPAMAMSAGSFGAGMVITLNLALRVPWRRSLPVLGLLVAASALNMVLVAIPSEELGTQLTMIFAYHLVFFAWGSALRARRELVHRLRKDARLERVEHARRLAATRRTEREAIAREMHDVLAHRISLVSVHAGALAYRSRQSAASAGPELSGAEVAESARIINVNAHQALDELRDVLRVLRDDDETEAAGPPQPRLADLPGLVDEARAAGQPVDLRDELAGDAADALRPQAQRTVYRVVQEGLTNARKHAPGAATTVLLTGEPGGQLTVEVGNPLPADRTSPEIPGAGAGLTGLGERVQLDGGVLSHHGRDGRFTLRARLPWPPNAR
ncbi:sensor histidine kinase [Amycolatopsis nigrescens]|uniref:sensor histidine kinase n=1 Tax=Amycolatopsis nigrescens TaxID=381445 RepID=UPI000373F387|nr:histidine kinase [Amycolatopsis nigrescens]